MKNELLKQLAAGGQEHLLAFWDELDDAGRQSLAEQIRAIDFDLIDRIFAHRHDVTDVRQLLQRAAPPPAFRLDESKNRFTGEEAQRRGEEAAAAGQLGVVLVAGGQGTRLGFEHPKGMFPIGPVSRRTLFQIHVEKIIAAARRYGVSIPLYLMTSPATHDETVAFFRDNDRFGLPEDDLIVFCQGTMPAVDAGTGKILLSERGRIATGPDGHGGMLAALKNSRALDDMRRRRIEHLFYFQVDNPLVDICGTRLVGYHLLAGSEFSTQVVAKQDPMDKVGNVVEADGRLVVIEYFDLPPDKAKHRELDGSLSIWAGSIAVHVMDVAFLERMARHGDALPFHTAYKKVAHVDRNGRRVKPDRENGVKFERLIFDLIPSAAGAIVVEVDPAEGFAPLKNAPGEEIDTPEWVKAQMVAQSRRWLAEAGAEVAEGIDVEICPLWALDAAEVADKIQPGTRITESTYFC